MSSLALPKPATGKGSRGPYKRRPKDPDAPVRSQSVLSTQSTRPLIPGEDPDDEEGTWEDDMEIDVGGGGETAAVRRRLNKVKEEQMLVPFFSFVFCSLSF